MTSPGQRKNGEDTEPQGTYATEGSLRSKIFPLQNPLKQTLVWWRTMVVPSIINESLRGKVMLMCLDQHIFENEWTSQTPTQVQAGGGGAAHL